ncbi:MAG TPA: efflux transporter outer membrane subunit [Solimonas sp.]|nr:efflux transporter outer membrane subunit [Solimonas sp.]
MRRSTAERRIADLRVPLCAGAAALLLSACSLAPEYHLPDVPGDAQYRASVDANADAGWAPATPQDHLSRGRWWTLYGDAQLDALAARVETGSPDLAAALAHYEQAAAYRDQTRAAYFPSLSLGGSIERERASAMQPPSGRSEKYFDSNSLGLSAAYELDLWGRVRNSVRAGNAGLEAAAADLESARLSLQVELVDDYVQLRRYDIETQLLQDSVVAYDKALQLTQTRHDGGIASGLDVARARTQLQTAKAQVSTTAAQRTLLEHAIAVLIGESPSTFTIAASTTPLSLPSIPLDLPATLLQRRPDVAAAERRTAAANATVGVARAAWFPSLNLGASAGYSSFETSDWFKASNLFWAIGPSLALDLFNGGLREAQIRQARAALDEAGAHYRAVALGAFAQVEDELTVLGRYRDAAADQALAVDAAQKALDYSMTRYREGAVNYLDVTVAQTAALQAQRDRLALETGRLRASVALVRALGGGWQVGDPVEQ